MLEALAALTAVAAVAVALPLRTRVFVAPAVFAASGLSVAASVAALMGAGRESGWPSLLESAALIALVFLALRRVPGRAGELAAATAARYLEALEVRRARSVAEARRAQRLALARDRHDFVAHDVSAMVVQAQAAQVVGAREPREALSALKRIEQAGLHALSAMDRAVDALRYAGPPTDVLVGEIEEQVP